MSDLFHVGAAVSFWAVLRLVKSNLEEEKSPHVLASLTTWVVSLVKMVNKRQHTDFNCPVLQKKHKTDKNELNGTVFKSMLKDPSETFKGKLELKRSIVKLI